VARQGVGSQSTETVRRIGVFVDYWYAYTSARQLFAPRGAPPPAWFGNVSPAALAGVVVKQPPMGARRSERRLAGLHVLIRHFDPEVHRGQLERVRRWELEGAAVMVGPSQDQGGGHWQSGLSVALASAVVDALDRGVYDTAVLFAGDGALWPMLEMLGGRDGAVELATWVAPDGAVPTGLAGAPGVWCHRLGEARFKQLSDDRRPGQHGPGAGRGPAAPDTAMAEALSAAGIAEAADAPVVAAPETTAPPDTEADTDGGRGVRRIAHRLFGSRDA
jgi:hypothetical protein